MWHWLILLGGPDHCIPGMLETFGIGGSYPVVIHKLSLSWPHLSTKGLAAEMSFCSFPSNLHRQQEFLFFITVLSMSPFFHLITQAGWSIGPTLSAFKELFDSCSLNAVSFRVDLRALPLKYSAVDPSFRVQATPWVNFNRWKFFLGYSNIPNPDQPWRGSVLARKMSECGNGSPHWETKLTSCWWLAEDCHVHIQREKHVAQF